MGAQNSDPAQERRGTDRHLFGVGHGGLRMRTVRLPSVAGPPLAWSALAGVRSRLPLDLQFLGEHDGVPDRP